MIGHVLADPIAGLGVIQPAHGPADEGLAVEHGLRRFDLKAGRRKQLAPQLRLGRGEHGGLGLVGPVQFGKDRHRLSPSLLFASTVAPTIEKSIGTRHDGGCRSAFMFLLSAGNLVFEQECPLCPRFLPLYPQLRTYYQRVLIVRSSCEGLSDARRRFARPTGTAVSQGFRTASRRACDAPHRRTTRSWPKALGNRLYGSLPTLLGIKPDAPRRYGQARPCSKWAVRGHRDE